MFTLTLTRSLQCSPGVSSGLGVNNKSFVEASPSLSGSLMSILTFKNSAKKLSLSHRCCRSQSL